MSKPKRTLIVVGVVFLLVGLEVGLTALKAPEATVRIVNLGDTPIVDLQLVCGASTVAVAPILPEAFIDVRVSGRSKEPLKVTFKQLNNALGGFQVADFDPAALRREQSILVLDIRTNEFARSVAPDETPSTLGRLTRNVSSWFGDERPEPLQ